MVESKKVEEEKKPMRTIADLPASYDPHSIPWEKWKEMRKEDETSTLFKNTYILNNYFDGWKLHDLTPHEEKLVKIIKEHSSAKKIAKAWENLPAKIMNFESGFDLKNRGIDSSKWFIPNTELEGFMLYGEFDCFTDKGGVCVGMHPDGTKLWIGHYKKGKRNGYCEVLWGGDWEGGYRKGDFLDDELHGQGEWKSVNEKATNQSIIYSQSRSFSI